MREMASFNSHALYGPLLDIRRHLSQTLLIHACCKVFTALFMLGIEKFSTRRQYWFQRLYNKDMTVVQGLNLVTQIWPSNSPDLSQIDFSFWNQTINFVNKIKPQSIFSNIKRAVGDYAANMDEQRLWKWGGMSRNWPQHLWLLKGPLRFFLL